MSELVDFLRARLDEDAMEIAKHPDGEDDWEFMATGETNYPCSPYLMIGKKRALAEVEAKRRIIEAHGLECRRLERARLAASDEVLALEAVSYGHGKRLLESLLRDLASAYSDHKDYRQEWAAT